MSEIGKIYEQETIRRIVHFRDEKITSDYKGKLYLT